MLGFEVSKRTIYRWMKRVPWDPEPDASTQWQPFF
jgi:hypothetical protein